MPTKKKSKKSTVGNPTRRKRGRPAGTTGSHKTSKASQTRKASLPRHRKRKQRDVDKTKRVWFGQSKFAQIRPGYMIDVRAYYAKGSKRRIENGYKLKRTQKGYLTTITKAWKKKKRILRNRPSIATTMKNLLERVSETVDEFLLESLTPATLFAPLTEEQRSSLEAEAARVLQSFNGDPVMAGRLVQIFDCNPDIHEAVDLETKRTNKRATQSKQKKTKLQYWKEFVHEQKLDLKKNAWLRNFYNLTLSMRSMEKDRLMTYLESVSAAKRRNSNGRTHIIPPSILLPENINKLRTIQTRGRAALKTLLDGDKYWDTKFKSTDVDSCGQANKDLDDGDKLGWTNLAPGAFVGIYSCLPQLHGQLLKACMKLDSRVNSSFWVEREKKVVRRGKKRKGRPVAHTQEIYQYGLQFHRVLEELVATELEHDGHIVHIGSTKIGFEIPNPIEQFSEEPMLRNVAPTRLCSLVGNLYRMDLVRLWEWEEIATLRRPDLYKLMEMMGWPTDVPDYSLDTLFPNIQELRTKVYKLLNQINCRIEGDGAAIVETMPFNFQSVGILLEPWQYTETAKNNPDAMAYLKEIQIDKYVLDTVGKATSKQIDTIEHVRILARQFMDPAINGGEYGLSVLRTHEPITADDVHKILESGDIPAAVAAFNNSFDDIILPTSFSSNSVNIFLTLAVTVGDNEHQQGVHGTMQGGTGSFNDALTFITRAMRKVPGAMWFATYRDVQVNCDLHGGRMTKPMSKSLQERKGGPSNQQWQNEWTVLFPNQVMPTSITAIKEQVTKKKLGVVCLSGFVDGNIGNKIHQATNRGKLFVGKDCMHGVAGQKKHSTKQSVARLPITIREGTLKKMKEDKIHKDKLTCADERYKALCLCDRTRYPEIPEVDVIYLRALCQLSWCFYSSIYDYNEGFVLLQLAAAVKFTLTHDACYGNGTPFAATSATGGKLSRTATMGLYYADCISIPIAARIISVEMVNTESGERGMQAPKKIVQHRTTYDVKNNAWNQIRRCSLAHDVVLNTNTRASDQNDHRRNRISKKSDELNISPERLSTFPGHEHRVGYYIHFTAEEVNSMTFVGFVSRISIDYWNCETKRRADGEDAFFFQNDEGDFDENGCIGTTILCDTETIGGARSFSLTLFNPRTMIKFLEEQELKPAIANAANVLVPGFSSFQVVVDKLKDEIAWGRRLGGLCHDLLTRAGAPDIPAMNSNNDAYEIGDITVVKDVAVHPTLYSSLCHWCHAVILIPENCGVTNGSIIACIECEEHSEIEGIDVEDLPADGDVAVGVVMAATLP